MYYKLNLDKNQKQLQIFQVMSPNLKRKKKYIDLKI